MTTFMRIVCVAVAFAIPSAAVAGDVVAAIKEKLDAPGKRQVAGSYGTVGILVFDVRDTRTFDAPARKKIVSVAVSGFGDVAGYVLRKNGTAVCSFYGVTDGVCLSLAGCVGGTVCR